MPTIQPLAPHPTRRSLCTALGGAGALALAAPLQVLAQTGTFPTKPVTVVAPYPPGGAADTSTQGTPARRARSMATSRACHVGERVSCSASSFSATTTMARS